MKCDSCGTTKNTSISFVDIEPSEDSSSWKRANICYKCLHRLDPDMWINREMWEDLKPMVNFDQLPEIK